MRAIVSVAVLSPATPRSRGAHGCVCVLLACLNEAGSGGVGSTGGKGGTALAIIANASATTTVAILGSIVVNGGVGAVSGTCGGGGAGTWPTQLVPVWHMHATR